MAFLDFIKNRNQQPSDAPEQKPKTAKQMYTREAAQEKASAKPVDQGLTTDQRAVLSDVQGKMQAWTPPENTPPPSPASPGAANPQPMAQKMENQENTAPALSPTSMQAGERSSEKESPAPSPETQEKSSQRPQTMQRPTPSWER